MLFLAVLVVLVTASVAPWQVTVVVGVVALALVALSRWRREQRRREAARRRAELAAQAVARRSERRQRRRDAIRGRTGIDVDLVVRALRDASGRVATRLRSRGEQVNSRLARRYGDPAAPAKDPWLDLEADVQALESRRRTEEMLRLSEALNEASRAARYEAAPQRSSERPER